MACRTRHHEQEVGEPIQIDDDDRLHRSLSQPDDAALGTPADRSGQVQPGAADAAPGQDEPPQRWSSASNPSIHCSRRSTSASWMTAFSTRLAMRAEGSARRAPTAKAGVALSRAGISRRRTSGAGRAETGIELVHVAVSLDARVGLRHTRLVEERRLSRIARFRVDPHAWNYMGWMPAPPVPQPATRQLFRRRLLSWYRVNGRSLPWRTTNHPSHILVSEVMLQQTQVDRVLPKYHEWLANIPRSKHWRRRTKTTSARRGGRSATTSAPSGSTRSRARASRDSVDSSHRIAKRSCRSRVSARTQPGRSAALPSVSAPRSSTPTSRGCCFAYSWPRATPRRTRCAAVSGICPRRWCPTSTSSTSIRA